MLDISDKRAWAGQFIDELRISNGGVTNEDREFLEREKPAIWRSVVVLQSQLGASIKTLATNLYQKDTRFVYELIQNAEDNDYEISTDPPWLSFTLNQHQIVIDSNEDGFAEDNIKAICSIGRSTKVYRQGYIGEKGIGFKSVFKVARKVHVQSEPYSFGFEYDKDNSEGNGLGMVTPLNEPHLELPKGVRTRIVLQLLKGCSRQKLCEDFLALPETLLLFLRRLKRISIRIMLPDKEYFQEYAFLTSSVSANHVCIRKTDMQGGDFFNHYWIKRRNVSDMPPDPARKGITTAQVVLAFPLVEDHADLADQHVYAFLPLRKIGFKFLIQSDFVTEASREDVSDSPWNQRLLEEVKTAFISTVNDAANGFLKHSTLKYRWLKYIPSVSTPEDFWEPLHENILKSLRSQRLFFARGLHDVQDHDLLRTAQQLRIVTANYKEDSTGDPLLPDLRNGSTCYLSEAYAGPLEYRVLRFLGTRDLSDRDFLDRLSQDLDDSNSKMKSMPADSKWHIQIAKLLTVAMDSGSNAKFIKTLPIVPLSNGTWARPLNASIFFPTSGGIAVPEDLGLSLVDKTASQNESRKALFALLGVRECAPAQIIPLIEQRHNLGRISRAEVTAQMKFLFWHHAEISSERLKIHFATRSGDWILRGPQATRWAYCPKSELDYALVNIIKTGRVEELGKQVAIANSFYYESLGPLGRRYDLTCIEWLRRFFDLKETPQLRSKSTVNTPVIEISPEVKYIAEHNSEYLLGILQADWSQYHQSNTWDRYFKSVSVPILNSIKKIPLKKTYLPLPRLRSIVEQLDLGDDFGFVAELKGIDDADASKWRFLSRFGVGVDEDESFWLQLLRQARSLADSRILNMKTCMEIYSHLQSFSAIGNSKTIRDAFEEECLVFFPSTSSSSTETWHNLSSCVLDGPPWYSDRFRIMSVPQYAKFRSFFQERLGCKPAEVEDFLISLQFVQSGCTTDKESKIPLLYEELGKQMLTAEDDVKEFTRSLFKAEKLVYNPKGKSWHAPLDCIWAEDSIQLPGKFSIATAHKQNRAFFQFLGIKKPNLAMHIAALRQRSEESPDRMAIMREILNICALSPTPEALRQLVECKCLPVRRVSGEVQWADSSEDFAIVDRVEYGDIFGRKVNVLDFSLEEVHGISPFLDGLGLHDHYTSTTVSETTHVEGGMLNQRLTEDLRRKSYAICRFAAHYGSIAALSHHQLVLAMEVYASDSITKAVKLRLKRRDIEVQSKTAYFHLEEVDEVLKLYVPKDKRRREVALLRELPRILLRHVGAQDLRFSSELGSIIAARSLFAVDILLERAGIIELEGIVRPPDTDDDDDGDDDPSDGGPSVSSQPEIHAPPRVLTSESPRASSDFSPRRNPSVPDAADYPRFTPGTSAYETPSYSPERPELYRELLDAVIQQAQSVPSLPSIGESIFATVAGSRAINTSAAVNSTAYGDKTVNIGAAGELFVYEILQNLLPGFNRGNWQSTIRHNVSIHDKYHDLANWPPPETADIVYKDSSKTLTKLLIEKGYLQPPVRIADSPTYFIEVKTTVSELRTPFYCSQAQSNMMEKKQLSRTDASNEIYLIARVFCLGASGMGLRLYMDPETLRSKKELIFRTDQYSVTPA